MLKKLQGKKELSLYTIAETKMKNRKNWEKTVVLNVHNEYLEVCQIEEYVSSALMIGDTLECRVITNESIFLMNALVYNIKLVSNSIVLKILNVQKQDNQRKHKRYEVTFSATFRKIGDIGEKYTVVNNVSLCGMSIITRDKLHKGDNIEVNIKYSNDCFVTAECTVMWVTQSEQNYFCGLSISHMDERNKAVHASLIRKLQSKELRKRYKLEQKANASIKARIEND